MPLTQAQRDAKRKTTFVRIEIALLKIIRKFARRNRTTVRLAIDKVLRERFATPRKEK